MLTIQWVVHWDDGVNFKHQLNADVYINLNNRTQEIADLKREQIHEILDIPDDHIIMNI